MPRGESEHFYDNESPSMNDAYMLGKEMMNRVRNKLGILTFWGGTEDRIFRSFFGAGALTVMDVWSRMKAEDLIPPEGGKFHRYLWALMFMKLYGNETSMCAKAGGVDPKTFRKHIWPFIEAMAELEYSVVSARPTFLFYVHMHANTTLRHCRFFSKTGKKVTRDVIAYWWSMEQISDFRG